jgi:hypothetical protein
MVIKTLKIIKQIIMQKIKQEAIADLKEWLEKTNCRKDNFQKRIDDINEKLNSGGILKAIFRQFEYLDNWYSNNFVYDLLVKETTTHKSEAVANGYHILTITDVLADLYANQNPPYLLFSNVAYYLANSISEKWYVESETLIKLINKGLNTNLKGGLDFKPSAWFIVEIANKGYNIIIDYSKFNYPKNMGVYQEALNNWNTNDLVLLDTIVTKLCDYHLENATYGDGENTADIQFDDSARFVYAYEILTWLSIREMIGVKNPEKFSHPLMNLALNKLPTVVTPMPKNELFERVLEKLKQ